ncbi:DoxX family protein [Longitalea arenae]|uniref:DoxX family protein n=1 Tax=Longitalea arenae TaxID=2812558 RepID=UPI001968227D|nr:DoxX family protein [Longitalea arenae]
MNSWFKQHADLGICIFRLFISLRILYGVVDNVLSWERMIEFSRFLAAFHFPLPVIAAILSVYAQLIAALLLLVGWMTRIASLLLIINFLVAVIVVHRNDSVETMTPALAMFFGAVLLLFTGPGKFAIDRV